MAWLLDTPTLEEFVVASPQHWSVKMADSAGLEEKEAAARDWIPRLTFFAD